MTKPAVLFVAVHLGPYQSLAPLESEFASHRCLFLVTGSARERRQSSGLPCCEPALILGERNEVSGHFLRAHGVEAIISGTSDGVTPDENIEVKAQVAGTEMNIPVFVVEDFPGNFPGSRDDIRVTGLFVETQGVDSIYRDRRSLIEKIYCLGNPRYDDSKRVGSAERDIRRAEMRRVLGLSQKAVLWAGQPDGVNSFETLSRLVLTLDAMGLTLLFKAHPRDPLYAQGAYMKLLSRINAWLDVTSVRDIAGLCCASDLVMTQFSSVGVEAGYFGTPSLFVLFPDLGQRYLQQQKGYAIVPWASLGCAFLLDTPDLAQDVLETAVYDEAARAQVQAKFSSLFRAKPASAPLVASTIHGVLRGTA